MRTRALTLFGATGILLAAAPFSRALEEAEFLRLHTALQAPADEAWHALPWRISVLAARDDAARQQKPVYMLVRSGHPLGCV